MQAGHARSAELPGDFAIWVFIFAELAVFALLFGAYALARAAHPALFAAGEQALDRRMAAAETVLLLSSGMAVAQAAHAVVRDRLRACRAWLHAALGLGCGFALLKSVELHADLARGVSLSADLFDMFYLSLNVFHFMHVLMGLVILGAVTRNAHAGRYDAAHPTGVLTGAAYWHMVDLLWIVLFFLLYVSH
ncbi:MAG: cytochrome c oxidase subunit 3 [Betaproteobacteria bacterium]|nr:cytochrome c oxidase subunit 3 [Betaproteobacteria bacterium]